MLRKLFSSPIVASWLNIGIKLITSILAIPFVLSHLSAEEINVWFLFSTVIIIGQSIVFGFNATFVRYLSYSYSGVRICDFMGIKAKFEKCDDRQADLEEFSSLFIVLKRVFLFFSIILFVLLGTAGSFSLLKPISLMSNSGEGWIAWAIVIVSQTIFLLNNYYQVYLEGINEVAKVQLIMAKVSLAGLFLILAVLLIHPTLISIIAVYQLVSLFNIFSIMYLAKKINNKFLSKMPPQPFKKDVFMVVFKTAWKSSVTTFAASLIKNISGILVANLLTTGQSAPFLLTKRIFDILDQFTNATFKAMVPKIASLRGKGDFELLIPLLNKLFYLAYGVFITGYLIFICFSDLLLELIDSNVHFGSVELIILFSFANIISRWGGFINIVSNQANNILEHIVIVIYGGLFFLFVFIFFKPLQELAFPLATLLSVTIANFLISRRAYSTIQTSFWRYERKVMIPVFGILCTINLVYYWIYA